MRVKSQKFSELDIGGRETCSGLSTSLGKTENTDTGTTNIAFRHG